MLITAQGFTNTQEIIITPCIQRTAGIGQIQIHCLNTLTVGLCFRICRPCTLSVHSDRREGAQNQTKRAPAQPNPGGARRPHQVHVIAISVHVEIRKGAAGRLVGPELESQVLL